MPQPTSTTDRRHYDFQVGDGATFCIGTDRYAYTVIKRTPATITIQADYATRNGPALYDWDYKRDFDGATTIARHTSQGWVAGGCAYITPGRHEYRDPSF